MFKFNSFLPNKLSINKKLNIGLVGSGKMAHEYFKVIKSFNHQIPTIVTKKNLKHDNNFSNHKFKNQFSSFETAIQKSKKIDAWIICTSWNKLNQYFKIALKYKIIFLIEKSIIISSRELRNIKKKISLDQQKNFLIAYNRNFYDYIENLILILKKDPPNNIFLHLPEPYALISQKQKKLKNKDMILFMTSHWITLILKIFKTLKFEIKINKFKKFIGKDNLNKTFIFNIENKKYKFPLIINLAPNNPSNISFKFYGNKRNIELSPIEQIKIQYKLNKVKKGKENIYISKSFVSQVDKKFKPGIKYMYYDFIKSCVTKEKRTFLGTTIDDLIMTYQFCEIMNRK
tara:strand:- start:4025 stop:5056 length:1032 start_codon:yes stop_codon:yes gene_type:complete